MRQLCGSYTPFSIVLSMNSCTSSISSHNNKYTFSFLNTNHSFISIAWSHIFLISILLLAFFPKTWIYLWNLGGTNFLTSFSDFTTSFSSSQISYSSAIFFTSIIHFFFGFLFSLLSSLLLFSLLSFFPSSFFSFSFYFCYPDLFCFDLYYFPHSFRYFVIFTSLVL